LSLKFGTKIALGNMTLKLYQTKEITKNVENKDSSWVYYFSPRRISKEWFLGMENHEHLNQATKW
jgi:hypothetical protein